MPELPNAAEGAPVDGAPSPKPNWQNRVGIILRWRSVQSALLLGAIAILGSSGYLFYAYKQRSLEAQNQIDRPLVVVINAAIEAVDEENISLALQLKNVAAKPAYSLVISVVGFNPATERGLELATLAGTEPMPGDIAFSLNAPISRAEMLPVVALCLLYADESKRGFTEHLYYDASEKPKGDDPLELRKLSGDISRIDDLKVCRL